jgi:hypothetical protein
LVDGVADGGAGPATMIVRTDRNRDGVWDEQSTNVMAPPPEEPDDAFSLPDLISPDTEVLGADHEWHRAPVALTFRAHDDPSGSGVVSTEYKLDDGDWIPGTSLAIPAPPNESRIHEVLVRSSDAVGNTEEAKIVEVKIDTIAPATSATGIDDGWQRQPVTVTLEASDLGRPCSGVAYTEYRLDGGDWVQGTSLTIPAPPDTQVTHKLLYRSADNAGNLEEAGSATIRIRTTVQDPTPQPLPSFVISAVVQGGHGSVSPSGSQTVTFGAKPTYVFSPDAGYHVGGVTVDGTPVALTGTHSYTFPGVSANHALGVSFAADATTPGTVVVTPIVRGGHGSVAPASPQSVALGATPTFTFTPDSGYDVAEVLVDGASVELNTPTSYTFAPVTADHTIAVTFAPKAGAGALTAKAPRALTARRGQAVALRYGVFATDGSGSATVTITIQNVTGKVVARKAIKDAPLNQMRTFRFACNLNRGAYKYSVTAAASDGRSTAEAAVNTLRVR